MNTPPAEERIAQLLARARAERLATELAIYEAREQLAPLRSAAGIFNRAAGVLSAKGTAGRLISAGSRYLVGHPWLVPAVAGAGLRLLRRRPVALLLALGAGAVAWWLFRPAGQPEDRTPR
jgi:hypothetical protein